MKNSILFLIVIVVISSSCVQPFKKVATQVVPRDKSITPANAYTQLFFDSAAMEKFIVTYSLNDSLVNRMRSFYNSRNYEYGWFFNDGIADYASTFLGMQNDYISYSGDSTLYNPQLSQLFDSLSNANYKFNTSDNNVLQAELMLTCQFFRYARRAYQGSNQLDAKELEWFIPRKKIDAVALLDSLIKNKGKNVQQYEPVNRQYNLLKNYLLKYYTIKQNGGWQKINTEKKSFKSGDSSATITLIKKRLLLEDDLTQNDTTPVFDTATQNAVKKFQHRYGLKEDGVADASVINEMNIPVDTFIHKILLNMERIRWVPQRPATDFLLINIPEFRLHVYEEGNYRWSMNVVVGSTVHNTVIFNGTLRYIVFSPYWNVPPTILKNEILPGISQNKNYLAAHNMEWNGNTVRQKPGLQNSLGLVKFLFPNSYNIYLHDTPSKNLFNENKRAFSHGCIRLDEPKRLALFLLRNDKSWDSSKIVKAMNAGKEQYVMLKDPIPVFIGYFTAWVDSNGKLNFRDDLYGHDKKMSDRLFATVASK
jgi:murein L,D-transpeptidase YcbB/YkuD